MSENVFISFSKSQLTIPQCFHILEHTRVELVLFETVKMIKNIVIYEWRGLNDDDKVVMRQKLLDYVLHNQNLPASVIERVLQIVAIMVKRKFLEDGGEELKVLLETIKGMIFGSQDNRVQQVRDGNYFRFNLIFLIQFRFLVPLLFLSSKNLQTL